MKEFEGEKVRIYKYIQTSETLSNTRINKTQTIRRIFALGEKKQFMCFLCCSPHECLLGCTTVQTEATNMLPEACKLTHYLQHRYSITDG